MEINNELLLMRENGNHPKDFLKSMNSVMEKKLHLFKVMELAYTIDFLLQDKKYKKLLSQMKIFNVGYPDRPLMIQFVDIKGNDLLRTQEDLIKQLRPIVEDIVTNKVEYTNVDIKVTETIKIDLKNDFKQEIFKHLLSQELSATLEYSQMQIDINNKSTNRSRRNKV